MSECKYDKFVFVVTGMSYIIDSSGTSKVVKAHEDLFESQGISYIVIFPISRSRGQGAEWKCQTTGCYGMVIDGRFVGVMTAVEVLNTLLALQKVGEKCIGILIHHIIRNDIYEVRNILGRIKNVPVVYYLHDFYTCCINPNMLKNDELSCVDGDVTCEGCVYYEKRKIHLHVIHDFFETFRNRLTFIAPSEYVKDSWSKYYPEYKVEVIPHQKAVGFYFGNKKQLDKSEHVRIGFVGAQKHIKGWDLYKEIVKELQKSHYNYKYYYFGNPVEDLPGVINVQVDIARMGKDAMIQALRKNEIAVVFLVSIWGETYSYTMYEAHAANSFILTMKSSGNIASTVAKEKWGLVFESKEALLRNLLDEGKFRTQVNEWRMNTAAGAERYLNNGDIIQMFSKDIKGNIFWTHKRETIDKKIKRALLTQIFILTRMKK